MEKKKIKFARYFIFLLMKKTFKIFCSFRELIVIIKRLKCSNQDYPKNFLDSGISKKKDKNSLIFHKNPFPISFRRTHFQKKKNYLNKGQVSCKLIVLELLRYMKKK